MMKRDVALSYSRAWATLAIIILHTAFTVLTTYGDNIAQSTYIWGNTLMNCSRWAVPVFLMVTGALLLPADKEISYQKLFGKYILRIFLALLIFSFVYNLFYLIMLGTTFSLSFIFKTLREVYSGETWKTMWYLYMLIGLYLMLPFYKKIIRTSNRLEIKYLLGLYVFFLSLLPFLKAAGFASGFYLDQLTIYPFYLFVGYAIYNRILFEKSLPVFLLAIISTLLLIFFTWLRWTRDIAFLDALWSYSSILVILQACSIFSIILYFDQRSQVREVDMTVASKIKRSFAADILLAIDDCCFGIYLIHTLLIKLVFVYWQWNPFAVSPVLTILHLLGFIIANLLLSYAFSKILKFFPVFKKIL